MKIVIFKEAKEFSRVKRQLKPLQVLKCPALSIRPKKIPSLRGDFDFLLVTSANALRFVRHRPRVRRVVAIGSETALSLRLKSQEKLKILKDSHTSGILRFFKAQKPAQVLYLRGDLSKKMGDKRLIPGLKKLGHRLKVIESYQTKILNLRAPLLRILSHQRPHFLFMTSPSTVAAIRKSFSLKEIHSFPVKWMAIGPTTQKALKSLKVRALVPSEAHLEAMKKLALRS